MVLFISKLSVEDDAVLLSAAENAPHGLYSGGEKMKRKELLKDFCCVVIDSVQRLTVLYGFCCWFKSKSNLIIHTLTFFTFHIKYVSNVEMISVSLVLLLRIWHSNASRQLDNILIINPVFM